jgi:hypothetical protein
MPFTAHFTATQSFATTSHFEFTAPAETMSGIQVLSARSCVQSSGWLQ